LSGCSRTAVQPLPVGQLNERLGQFIALLEYGRTLDATARLARSIAYLFNPILYPDLTLHLEITQEEIGALPASPGKTPTGA
jgi:CRP/FNR family cyclic AMP-dependent transcriptional regulator